MKQAALARQGRGLDSSKFSIIQSQSDKIIYLPRTFESWPFDRWQDNTLACVVALLPTPPRPPNVKTERKVLAELSRIVERLAAELKTL